MVVRGWRDVRDSGPASSAVIGHQLPCLASARLFFPCFWVRDSGSVRDVAFFTPVCSRYGLITGCAVRCDEDLVEEVW